MCAIASMATPLQRARLIGRTTRRELFGYERCLTFLYHAFGHDIGSLQILNEYDDVIWSTNKRTSNL